jgi:GNAT superfamily N-acetyltransferase
VSGQGLGADAAPAPTIRHALPEDAPALARVRVDTWRSTYAGIVPDDYLAGMDYGQEEANSARFLRNPFPGTFVLVAEPQPGLVAGFALGGPPQKPFPGYDCELHALYVLKEHQGRGLGTLLMEHVTRELTGRGLGAMFVWVLRDSPACRFYESLGGRRIRKATVEVGSASLQEVAYGWPDLSNGLAAQA